MGLRSQSCRKNSRAGRKKRRFVRGTGNTGIFQPYFEGFTLFFAARSQNYLDVHGVESVEYMAQKCQNPVHAHATHTV